MEQPSNALGETGINLDGIAIAGLPIVQAASRNWGRSEFNDKVDHVIVEGKSVIVLASPPDDLPPSAEMLCTRPVSLPQITGDMIIEILRPSPTACLVYQGRKLQPSSATHVTMHVMVTRRSGTSISEPLSTISPLSAGRRICTASPSTRQAMP